MSDFAVGYIVGTLFGDGYLNEYHGNDGRSNHYTIGLTVGTPSFAKQFASCLEKVLEKKTTQFVQPPSSRIHMLHGKIVHARKPRYNVKARSKAWFYRFQNIKTEVLKGAKFDTEFKRGFVKGFFDSDGCLTHDRQVNRPRLFVYNMNQKLLGIIREMIEELVGAKVKMRTYRHRVPFLDVSMTDVNNVVEFFGLQSKR